MIPRTSPPLPVRHLAAASKPPKLLQQNVFGRVGVELRALLADGDRHTPPQQIVVEGRAACDEGIHLDRCRSMNQISARAIPNCALEHRWFDVEFLFNCLREAI
jgi:hypothetical protein